MTTIRTISQWQAAGGKQSGWALLYNATDQTQNAIGFRSQRNNKPSICWIAKDKLVVVENDIAPFQPPRLFMTPAWLYLTKTEEGYSFGGKDSLPSKI